MPHRDPGDIGQEIAQHRRLSEQHMQAHCEHRHDDDGKQH
jgi:hypothetical protein